MLNIRGIAVIIALLILLSGCAATKNPEVAKASPNLRELAVFERDSLKDIEAIRQEIENYHRSWLEGKITRAEYATAVKDLETRSNEISKKYDQFVQEHPLTEEDKNLSIYKDGLKNGKALRTRLNTFLNQVTMGKAVLKNNKISYINMSDDELKESYSTKIKSEYPDQLDKLKKTLKDFQLSEL